MNTLQQPASKTKNKMLARATVLIFIFSICLTEGSNRCPPECTCTNSGREVDCSGKDLNTIPILPVSDVMTLNVSFSNISVAVPSDSDDWERQLKFFYLNNNYIKDVTKFDFQSFPELMHVYLDHNLIADVDPHAFEENTKLWKLVLNGNKLTVPKHTEFLVVSSLGWIELKNCSISDLAVNFFKDMPNLAFIGLSYNQIEKLDLELFSHLRKLRYLHLEGNKIKEIHPDIFKTNHVLEWLYLRGNPLNPLNASHLLHAASLLSLDISYCNITKIPNKFFSNLHNLLSLKLNGNLLAFFSMKSVPQSLEVLDISGNSMTAIDVTEETIRRLTNLKHFALTNNSFACECRLSHLWTWCAVLRNGLGGASSCDEMCPDLELETCGKAGRTAMGHNHVRMNTVAGENDVDPAKSEDQENGDVETLTGPGVVSGKDANNTSGNLKINDEDFPAILGSTADDEGSERLWSIITYSFIAVFGGLCLIGAIALVTDTFLGCRKPRTRVPATSAKSTSRNIRLELTDPNEDMQEMTPLSHHRGLDFVSQPTNAHTKSQYVTSQLS